MRTTKALLSDQTWEELRPGAGALSRRTTVRLWSGVALAVVAAVAAALVWWSGLVAPHLTADGTGYSADTATQRVTLTVDVVNHGWHAEEVVAAGRSGPGLTLERVSGVPQRLLSGASGTITLDYQVTDCAAVPSGAWPVPVRAHRWWGSSSAALRVADQPVVSSSSSASVPWQVALARTACGRGD